MGRRWARRVMTKQADGTGRARRCYQSRKRELLSPRSGRDFMDEYRIVLWLVGQHPHDRANEVHMNGWPYGRDAWRAHTRAEVNRRGGWRRRSGCGREGSHVERRAGIVEGCGRVRGIASNLRFIWIGLFIAGCHEYLSTRPRPEVRFLFPPLVYYKNYFFDPFLSLR